VSGKLEDGTLAIGTSRDDTNIGWIIDGDNDAGSEDNFFPNGSMLEQMPWNLNILIEWGGTRSSQY
jgi:hypothetical protein